MVELSTTYMGVKLKNPLIIGGGPTTHTPEICAKAAKAGWAGVVLKTNQADEMAEHISPTTIARPYYSLRSPRGVEPWKPTVPKLKDGLSRGGKKRGKIPTDYFVAINIPMTASPPHVYSGIGTYYNGDEAYLNYINRTKELVAGENCKVIASVAALTEKGWEQQCRLINRSNADMVELNFGCWALGAINPQTGQWGTGGAGAFPELVEKFTRFCVQRINKIPVGVKLPPHAHSPLASVQAAVRGGAKGIQWSDSPIYLPPIPPLIIDPDTLQLGVFPGSPFSGAHSGFWALPYTCGCVANFRLNGIAVDISGCGGIRVPMDIIRLLMAGANSVQVCQTTMVEGVGVGEEYLTEITGWLEGKGYKSIQDITGVVVKPDQLKLNPEKLTPIETPQILGGPAPSVQIELNEKRCIKCGWCEECCFHLAISRPDAESRPVIDRKSCEVCGMCVAVCPAKALSIVPS